MIVTWWVNGGIIATVGVTEDYAEFRENSEKKAAL